MNPDARPELFLQVKKGVIRFDSIGDNGGSRHYPFAGRLEYATVSRFVRSVIVCIDDELFFSFQERVAQAITVCRNTVSLPAPLRAVYPLTTRTHSICELVLRTQTTQIALRAVLPRRVGSHPVLEVATREKFFRQW